jgi:predicted secreted hydrolase
LRRPRSIFALLSIAVLLGLTAVLLVSLSREQPRLRSTIAAAKGETRGFTRARGPAELRFPDDLGAHPDFQTEWWYYTGNLQTGEGRHFGYQLTIFRRGLAPSAERQERTSAWATNDVYMGHLALTDVGGRSHTYEERFSRGAAGLAGATADPYRVWLEDWQVESQGPDRYHLRAGGEDMQLDLILDDRKGPILHGERGYSRKGPDPGNASYYYSQTRLETSGVVRLGGRVHEVTGASWMDHEWSTGGLAPEQVGWDWFSLQLDDGSELMAFQLRQEDGSIDRYSSGTLVQPDGRSQPLGPEDFLIRATDIWRSPRSGADYPSRWTLEVPSAGLNLDIRPYLADQEMMTSIIYWEGAVRANGERDGAPLTGDGYVELTGYASPMRERF